MMMQQECPYGPPKNSGGNQMDDMWSLMTEFLNSNDAGNFNRGPPAPFCNAAISLDHNARTMRGNQILEPNSAFGHLVSYPSFYEDNPRPALLHSVPGTRTMDPCIPDSFAMNAAHPILWDALNTEWDGPSQFGLPQEQHLTEEAAEVTLEWNHATSSSELPDGSLQGDSPGLSFLPSKHTSRKSVSVPLQYEFQRPDLSRDSSSGRTGVATPLPRSRKCIPDRPLDPSGQSFSAGMRGGVGQRTPSPKTNLKKGREHAVRLGAGRMGIGGPQKSPRATEGQRSPTGDSSQVAGGVRDESPEVGSASGAIESPEVGSASIDVQLESDQEEENPGSRRVGEGKQSVNPRSIAERMRRERISVRLQRLKDVMHRSEAKIDTSAMLDDAVTYIRSLQNRCKRLEAQNAAMAMQLAQPPLQAEQMHNNP